jgi:hypothetical protein
LKTRKENLTSWRKDWTMYRGIICQEADPLGEINSSEKNFSQEVPLPLRKNKRATEGTYFLPVSLKILSEYF